MMRNETLGLAVLAGAVIPGSGAVLHDEPLQLGSAFFVSHMVCSCFCRWWMVLSLFHFLKDRNRQATQHKDRSSHSPAADHRAASAALACAGGSQRIVMVDRRSGHSRSISGTVPAASELDVASVAG